jgi:hypothetical protein
MHDVALSSEGMDVFRFDQRVAGHDVLNSEAVVVKFGDDPAELVADDTVEDVDKPGEPKVSKREATEKALETVHPGEDGHAEARLEIQPTSDGGRYVWVVAVIDGPRENELVIGARTGKIYDRDNDTVQATGAAAVFDPNPVAANGGPQGLPPTGNEDTPLLTSLRTEVPLPDLVEGTLCLVGRFAYVTVGPRGADQDVCAANLDWRSVTRSDDRFEALMAYFTIDRMQRYYQALGFNGTAFPTVLARQLRVRVNALSEQNSFYETASKSLIFGRGEIDEGEDGDGIAHEYGHATQAAQVPGWGATPAGRALGEGFGDYLAAINSALAGTDPFFQVCMYEWVDFAKFTTTGCSRRADTTLTLRQVKAPPCNFEEHCAGQAWSSALWSLRQQIGAGPDGVNIIDRLVLASQFMLTPKASFFDAADAMIKAQDGIYRNPAVRQAMFDEFQARGFIR